jgi:hypothetical protein
MASWYQKILCLFKKSAKPNSSPCADVQQPILPPSAAALDSVSTETSTSAHREASSALITPPPSSPALPQPVVDLTIGFDLGTSCSKVVIGDSLLGNQYGVPFNPSAKGVNKYLFPTRLYEWADGISISARTEATLVSNLKLSLTEAVQNQTDTTEPEMDLAIYMALVLKHTLSWYHQYRTGDHRARARCWWISVGFPAKRTDNNPRLHQAYQRLTGAAIQAVNSGEQINRALVKRSLGGSSHNGDSSYILSSDRVNFYPEIAAQLAGYAISRHRVHGPLMLIDVGAGTLDISTLILHHRDQEEVCSFQFCEVLQLGAFRLYQHLHESLACVSPHAVDALVSIGSDQNWQVPESASEYLQASSVVTLSMKNAFHLARESFADKCLENALSNFSDFKRYLDEPFREVGQRPPAFRKNVNIILSGGGSRAVFYRKLFPERLEETVVKSGLTLWNMDHKQRKIHGEGFHSRHLMKPEKFIVDGVESDDFDRLSVAHGLALSSETLLQITAKEMSDRQWNAK